MLQEGSSLFCPFFYSRILNCVCRFDDKILFYVRWGYIFCQLTQYYTKPSLGETLWDKTELYVMIFQNAALLEVPFNILQSKTDNFLSFSKLIIFHENIIKQ